MHRTAKKPVKGKTTGYANKRTQRPAQQAAKGVKAYVMKRYLIKFWNSQGWERLEEKRFHKHRTDNIRRTARNIFILDQEIDTITYQENEGDEYTLIRRHEFNYNVVCTEGDGEKRPIDLVFASHNHYTARREFFRKS